jgi:hypothetical protein
LHIFDRVEGWDNYTAKVAREAKEAMQRKNYIAKVAREANEALQRK